MGENAGRGGALLLGRVTYDQMASFWATPAGRAANAAVADGMTRMRTRAFAHGNVVSWYEPAGPERPPHW